MMSPTTETTWTCHQNADGTFTMGDHTWTPGEGTCPGPTPTEPTRPRGRRAAARTGTADEDPQGGPAPGPPARDPERDAAARSSWRRLMPGSSTLDVRARISCGSSLARLPDATASGTPTRAPRTPPATTAPIAASGVATAAAANPEQIATNAAVTIDRSCPCDGAGVRMPPSPSRTRARRPKPETVERRRARGAGRDRPPRAPGRAASRRRRLPCEEHRRSFLVMVALLISGP